MMNEWLVPPCEPDRAPKFGHYLPATSLYTYVNLYDYGVLGIINFIISDYPWSESFFSHWDLVFALSYDRPFHRARFMGFRYPLDSFKHI